MNVERLIRDFLDSTPATGVLPSNRFDAAITLLANHVTNALAGDLADPNIEVLLDREFLAAAQALAIQIPALGMALPSLSFGLLNLRTAGRIERSLGQESFHGALRASLLLDPYLGALPTGSWDDLLLPSLCGTAVGLLRMLRPDVARQLPADEAAAWNRWLQESGIRELPLFRSSIPKIPEDQTATARLQIPHSGVAYGYQKVHASDFPRPEDLLIGHETPHRWLGVPGSLLVYKTARKLHDVRRFSKDLTVAAGWRTTASGPRTVRLHIGMLGQRCDLEVDVLMAKSTKTLRFEQVSGAVFEFALARWVAGARFKIRCSAPYVADVQI